MEQIKSKNKITKIITNANELTIGTLNRCEEILKDPLLSELNRNIRIVQELSNLTVEEIEDLPMAVLIQTVNIIGSSNYNLDDSEFRNEFIVDGVTFRNRAESKEDISFSVKEIFTLRELFQKSKHKNMVTIASVIFREVDIDGNISRDLTTEAITKRNVFLEKMTLDIISPYIAEIERSL
tara:strand:- start:332 stop:874 length:543 start_codon:yes stop_codon:yes gene_type:complete